MELLVVVAIVVITLSIIVPSIVAVVRSGWKSTVSQIGAEPAATPVYAGQEHNQVSTATLRFQNQAGLVRALSLLSTNGFSVDPATGYLISTQ